MTPHSLTWPLFNSSRGTWHVDSCNTYLGTRWRSSCVLLT